MKLTNVGTLVIGGMISLVLVFYIFAALVPEFQTALAQISILGLPLSGLFSANGVLVLALMAGLIGYGIYTVVKMFKHN